MPEGKLSVNSYIQYETRPRFLTWDEIEPRGDGAYLVRPRSEHGLAFQEISIAESRVFDLLDHTMYGLVDNLVPGSLLAQDFMQEYDEHFGDVDDFSYGQWVYYPGEEHLVRYSPKFWHLLSLVIRNSTLYRDSEMKLSWGEVRSIFDRTIVAVAGCSVGSSAAHAVVRDLRPQHIKVADVSEYKVSNANRVHVGYRDFGRNKAIVTAEHIHATDPFMNISVYADGVHELNVRNFIYGNKETGEPRASLIIEETDDPYMKIMIREEARKHGVPVVMVTDMGSAVQLDVRRFDRDKSLSLTYGISDEELFEKRDQCKNDPNRENFYTFAFALIGHNHIHTPEFRRIILQEDPPIFGGIPQLGSTVMMAGGIAAETVARIMLGYPRRERVFIDKNTANVREEGRMI